MSNQNCTRTNPLLTVGIYEPSNGAEHALVYHVVLSITHSIQA